MIEKWKINEAAFKCSTSYSGNEFVEGVKWAEKEIFEDQIADYWIDYYKSADQGTLADMVYALD